MQLSSCANLYAIIFIGVKWLYIFILLSGQSIRFIGDEIKTSIIFHKYMEIKPDILLFI